MTTFTRLATFVLLFAGIILQAQTYITDGIKMEKNAFDPDPRYYKNNQYISFRQPGVSEDFIGYQNNHFYIKDASTSRRAQPHLTIGGRLYVEGAEFSIGTNDGRSVGNKPSQRAMIHFPNDVLVFNFDGDFEGGMQFRGPHSIFKNNVIIGTLNTDTGNHKLVVEGSIGAREIKVEPSGWSDFVFADDYMLPTLEEVATYIENNNHLPDIPSEKEVLDQGINLGEMNSKLLQKIEELTLYMIEAHKQTNALQQEVNKLKKELDALKK